jgi:putative NADH-flavin reductase
MHIAVPVGTGADGQHVVSIASDRGRRVTRLTRSEGVDLFTSLGLQEALHHVHISRAACDA